MQHVFAQFLSESLQIRGCYHAVIQKPDQIPSHMRLFQFQLNTRIATLTPTEKELETARMVLSGQLKIFDNKDILYFKNPLRSGGHHPEERVDWGRLKYYSYIGTHAFYLTDFSEVGKY